HLRVADFHHARKTARREEAVRARRTADEETAHLARQAAHQAVVGVARKRIRRSEAGADERLLCDASADAEALDFPGAKGVRRRAAAAERMIGPEIRAGE